MNPLSNLYFIFILACLLQTLMSLFLAATSSLIAFFYLYSSDLKKSFLCIQECLSDVECKSLIQCQIEC